MKTKLITLVGAVFCLLISIASSRAATRVEAIEELAITVFDMNLQNGIENSLDSKLDAALGALDDANASNDVAACNTLGAFINAVEAQRGMKITNAQADQLIAAAQEIRSMLNCGDPCEPVMWFVDRD